MLLFNALIFKRLKAQFSIHGLWTTNATGKCPSKF